MNNDDGDYTGVDEIMHYMTIIVLFLMAIVLLGAVAGFVWGML